MSPTLSDMYRDNLVSVYQSASPTDIHDGLNWYREAKLFAQALSGWLKVTHPGDTTRQLEQRAAGIIAVLSPRQTWANNKRFALAVAKLVAIGMPELLDLLPVFEANMTKAKALATADFSEALMDSQVRGPKVSAFYNNILGSADHITLDTHAINACRGVIEYNPTQPRGHERQAMLDAYNELACLISEDLGHKVTPSQAQAIVWVAWRHNIHGDHKLG